VLHATNDLVGLTLARTIASRLADHPEWIELARGNLRRWKLRNAGSRSVVNYDEWLAILEKPAAEVMAIYTQETDEGQRLRQNSPFGGAITPQEVWAMKERCRRGTI